MDEFKIIFWIIVGLIYIISKTRSKQKKQSQSTDERTDSAPESKPISFEDLLREIQQAKNPKPEPPVQQKPVLQTSTAQRPAKPYDYKDYDDDIEEEEKREVVRPDYKSDDKIYDVYEEAKKQAFVKPSLEDTMKLEDTVVRFDHFKGYKQEKANTLGISYLKEFNDPEGFKKAFIMSEILKRKF
jgi:hypothetical protein